MKSVVDNINSVQRRITIEIPNDEVNNIFKDVFEEIRKNAKIKGFRPGKTPVKLIEKLYGDAAAVDVAEKIVKSNLYEALRQNELLPVSSPVIENFGPAKLGEKFSFSAIIDIMPQINIVGYQGLNISYQAEETKDKDRQVAEELQTLQKRHARRRSLSPDTSAAQGHVAIVTIKAFDNGQVITELNEEKSTIEIGKGFLPKELDDGLIDMTAGQEKQLTVTFPKDFHDPKLADKPVNMLVHVHELYELDLPQLDDEFAKDLNYQSLEKLKNHILFHIEEHIESKKRTEIENQILTKLRELNAFEVPPSLIDHAIDQMINDSQLSHSHKQNAAKDQELRNGLRDTAKRQVQNTLMLMQISGLEKIEVTDHDIERHLKHYLHIHDDADEQPEAVKNMLAGLDQNTKKHLKEQLLVKKTIDFLIDHANIKEMKTKG